MDSLLIKSPSWARAGAGHPTAERTDPLEGIPQPRGASQKLSHVQQQSNQPLLCASQSQTSHHQHSQPRIT